MLMSDAKKQTGNSIPSILLAALVQGAMTAAIVAVVLWLWSRNGEGPVQAPYDTVFLVALPLGAMAAAVWSRRPGRPRQGVFR